MLITILVVNIVFVAFLFIVRSKQNIESRTDREEKILNYHQNTVLILDIDSSFVVKTRNNSLPNRPFCEIYFSEETNSIIDHMIK